MNRTFAWGAVSAAFLSVLSFVPRHCAHCLHPNLRDINAVLITPKLVALPPRHLRCACGAHEAFPVAARVSSPSNRLSLAPNRPRLAVDQRCLAVCSAHLAPAGLPESHAVKAEDTITTGVSNASEHIQTVDRLLMDCLRTIHDPSLTHDVRQLLTSARSACPRDLQSVIWERTQRPRGGHVSLGNPPPPAPRHALGQKKCKEEVTPPPHPPTPPPPSPSRSPGLRRQCTVCIRQGHVQSVSQLFTLNSMSLLKWTVMN